MTDKDKIRNMLLRTIVNIDKMILQHKKNEMESRVVVYKDGVEIYSGLNVTEVSERFTINYTTISKCLSGILKGARGYTFDMVYYRKEDIEVE